MRFPVAWNRLSKKEERHAEEQAPTQVASPVLQRRNATKRRRRVAPLVTERASSLYHRQTGSVRSRVSYTSTASSDSSHDIPSTPTSYQTHLYHLKENPSLYFPTPPPRLSVYNDKRHTDIWDDLFDYAEACTFYGQQEQQPAACYSSLDLTEGKVKKARNSLFGLKSLAMRSEIWSKSTSSDMESPVSAPVVPPRSRLRDTTAGPSTSHSTYLLAVDEPILNVDTPDRTPPLSASSSSHHGSPTYLPISPPADTISFGRKKSSPAGLGKDPLRVKDGAEPRRATSGVYTPTTFPGASGPRPSHFPSHVYTPTNFTLYPAAPIGTSSQCPPFDSASSRSSSISSYEYDTPQTPGSRLSSFSGKALTGLKRISHQLPKVTQPPVISSPISARDSYFPSTIHGDVSKVWAPQTPYVSVKPMSTSPYEAHNAQGLGMGLTEQDGTFIRPDDKPRMPSVLFDEDTADAMAAQKTSPQPKGRRKPVPKILDDQVLGQMAELKV